MPYMINWLGRVNRGLRGFYIARRICGPFQQTMIAKFVGSSTRTEWRRSNACSDVPLQRLHQPSWQEPGTIPVRSTIVHDWNGRCCQPTRQNLSVVWFCRWSLWTRINEWLSCGGLSSDLSFGLSHSDVCAANWLLFVSWSKLQFTSEESLIRVDSNATEQKFRPASSQCGWSTDIMQPWRLQFVILEDRLLASCSLFFSWRTEILWCQLLARL
jgi:hypothetical protein